MSDGARSYCGIMVGRAMTGIVGLQEVFEALQNEGLEADSPGLGPRLVTEVKKHNYVPNSARQVYEDALLREYRKHLEAQRTGKAQHTWRDPRKEHKPWYPTLFEEKCDGCGACLAACPNNVLGWHPDRAKVLVLEPYECAPGCVLCAQACRPKAIVMPPRAVLYQRVDRPAGSNCATCGQCGKEDEA